MASGDGTPRSYTISAETARGAVDSAVLTDEILDESAITTTLSHVNTSGDTLDVYFASALSGAEITALDAVVAAHEGVPLAGTLRAGGGLIVEDLDDPSAPTVAAQGTTGSTSWGYKVTAFSDTGETLASSETQISNGNATLSKTNYNAVSWDPVVGAVKYGVYRTTAGGTPSSTGKVAETPALSYDDKGKVASGSTPSEDLSGGVSVGPDLGESKTKLVTVKEETSDLSTVTSLIRFIRKSTGTVAAGFGSGIYGVLADAAGTLRDAASIHWRWHNPAAGVLQTKVRIQTRDGGSDADKDHEFFYNGKITFDGTTLVEKTTCRAFYPASAAQRTGTAEAYSNNSRQCIRLLATSTGGFRINLPVPRNYASGDLTFRLLYTVTANQASNRAIAYDFSWRGDAIGTTFETMHNEVDTHDTSSQIGDRPYALDLSLASANFDVDDDQLSFVFERVGGDSGDTCTTSFCVHGFELRYTGWAFAGQAGQ